MTSHERDQGESARRTVYILGSGISLGDLSADEKTYLSGQTTIAMNKYMLFWELVGIYPTHFFLADIHHPALRVYEESLEITRRAGRPVHFFLADEFRRLYGGGRIKQWANFPFRANYYRQHGFWYSPGLTPPQVTYFHRCQKWNAPQVWGRTLKDLMYFYRGSLSVLLNLITVLKLGTCVKLLGVDLNTAASFYDEAIQQRPDLFDQYMKSTRAVPAVQHMTAQTYQGMPGIQSRWPFIRDNYAREGIGLYCCNRKSLLVEDGLCPYAPVIDPEENVG